MGIGGCLRPVSTNRRHLRVSIRLDAAWVLGVVGYGSCRKGKCRFNPLGRGMGIGGVGLSIIPPIWGGRFQSAWTRHGYWG